jgi:hypothetical protein
MARNNKSPLTKAGVILSDKTTTIGDSVFTITEEPFHIAKAEATTIKVFRN